MSSQPDLTHGSVVTSTVLLAGLNDPDDQTTWRHYVDRYRPLLVRYAQRLGAREDDAEDLAQQILIAFSTAYRDGKYDREKGRLRDWMFGIARNQIMNGFRRGRGREVQIVDDSGATGFLARIGEPGALQEIWEQEWRDGVVRQCLLQVRAEVQETTYEAFELFACRGWSAERVAEHLGLTQNAVFGAKRRVLERIRDLRVELEEIW